VAQFLAGGKDVDLEVGRKILPKIKTNNRLISRFKFYFCKIF